MKVLNLIKKLFGIKTPETSPAKSTGTFNQEEQILSEFRNKYKIEFTEKSILLTAFKHRSYLNITNEDRVASNERLEFLGDAVLDLVVTENLYKKFPKRTEGQLSKIKSILVSKPVLAEIATELSFGNLILINKGEEKTGGRQRESILSDTFEAVIGAVYLDKGYQDAQAFIQQSLLTKFKSIMQRELFTNYKSILLEHAQSKFGTLPEYRVLEEMGPDHEKLFIIAVYIDGKEIGKGQGKSKKTAEQEAARIAVQHLRVPNGENASN
jgi:ribonuclease-3